MPVYATDIDRVKALLDISSAAHDDELTTMVKGVSTRIETFIDRALSSEARTEEYSIRPRQNVLYLRSYPVSSITSIKVATDWDYASAAALATTDFHLDGETGMVHLTYFPVTNYLGDNNATAPNAVQVVYTGGFETNTANFIAAYPDIALAADLQIVATWRRRDMPQGKNVSMQGSSMAYEQPLQFVPDAVQALTPYRRLRFAANS